jgi:hypothetical protein
MKYLKNYQVGEPVFLTENGMYRFVVIDIEDYESIKQKRGFRDLQEAEANVKNVKG